jgi:protein-tyrosine phosphatase
MRGVRRVLMVCTGNICRSPTMEAVLRHHALAAGLEIEFDSAGTESYHVGDPPDPRSQKVALQRGYALAHLRARKVRVPDDFLHFDLLLAADETHLEWLRASCPKEHQNKLRLFLNDRALPDPYYDGIEAFEGVLDAVEGAASHWLKVLSTSKD